MADVNEHKKSNVADLLRWLLVLPAAVGGLFLAGFLLHWVIFCTFRYSETIQLSPEAAEALERTVFPLVGAASFVYWGARVAPRRHVAISIVLTLMLFSLVIASLMFGVRQHVIYVPNLARSLFMTGLFVLGTGIGILLTFFRARERGKTVRYG